jgi:DNA-binding NarL/FixJ family response regulator
MDQVISRIIIIEDNDIVKEGFKLLISSLSEHQVVATYENCEEAIKNLDKDQPDIILMDIELPGISGIEGTRIIKKQHPDIEILVITVHDDSDLVFQALVAGASGYITKNAPHNKILDAINEIAKGGAPMSSKIARLVVESFQRNQNSPLSPRETEVLELLSEGKSYSVIADELFIHKETVKSHIKNIYYKLQVNSKAAAIEVARKNKLI